MTETREDLTDIAWLRGLAEQGARAPVQGASILFTAGLIYGTASLAHWAIETGLVAAPDTVFSAIWGVAVVVFLLALVALLTRLKRQGGVETAAGRAFGSVWAAVGWGFFALFGSLIVGDLVRDGSSDLADLALIIPSIVMCFYGIGWAVSATMMRSRALWALALSSFAAAPVLAALAGSPSQYLAYAAALFGLMALPGFLLMRAARR